MILAIKCQVWLLIQLISNLEYSLGIKTEHLYLLGRNYQAAQLEAVGLDRLEV